MPPDDVVEDGEAWGDPVLEFELDGCGSADWVDGDADDEGGGGAGSAPTCGLPVFPP
ncbi:MAG TPA: hypothetical protein VHF47_05290 [Acidimicrobiales bacterium]|nr:hypothetical protein [Acidimicrobiales bacterium]